NQNPASAAAEADKRKAGRVVTNDPHFKSGYYRGACWYERALQIPAEWKWKKRVFVRFEAASQVARVYINKRMLGEHRGAFTAFCFELTPYLDHGQPNELRVEVDNTHREDMAPLSGDFNLLGGLYRPVTLIVTDEVCITPLDFASPGVYFTTRSLDDAQAVVDARIIVSNGKRETFPVIVETEITDAGGRRVSFARTEQTLAGRDDASYAQTLVIPNPRRWHGRKDPYLYTATVRVLRDGAVVDEVVQSLGLRTFAITRDQGFVLNGESYPVYGVNRHQDLRGKGWALTPQDEEADAAMIMDIGATAVRNAHYPQSESWHRLGDRLGLLMWDEVPLVNETRATREFWENTYGQMREMVRQLHNHPGVVWWGIFNELDNRPTPPSGPELARLQELAKELDPTRIVVGASDFGNRYYNRVPEHIGFNNYPGWYRGNWPKEENYRGDLEQMAEFIAFRAKEVGHRVAVSEYGAGGDIAHHTEGPPVKPEPAHGGPFHPEEYQTWVHERDWAQMKDNPNLWGTFLWAMFDFAVAHRNEGGVAALNTKGIVTHDRRVKKDSYFLYRANWSSEPTVYITSRRSRSRVQPVTEIKVFSNAETVELKVNGVSLDSVVPDTLKVCRWPEVRLAPGVNRIEAIGRFGGGVTTDACEWTLVAP
ncbi:MAG TPA: glycoside hydrolase family 2 TIM barrel-domain containing protein, partial [Rariglobus sp.]